MRPIRLFVVDHIPAKPENLLTHFFFAALSELYKRDASVIREFLIHAGVEEAARWGTDAVEILEQVRQGEGDERGILDVAIRRPGEFYVVVEAKLGASVDLEQLKRYARHARGEEPAWWVLSLTPRAADALEVRRIGDPRITHATWQRLYRFVQGLPVQAEVELVRQWLHELMEEKGLVPVRINWQPEDALRRAVQTAWDLKRSLEELLNRVVAHLPAEFERVGVDRWYDWLLKDQEGLRYRLRILKNRKEYPFDSYIHLDPFRRSIVYCLYASIFYMDRNRARPPYTYLREAVESLADWADEAARQADGAEALTYQVSVGCWDDPAWTGSVARARELASDLGRILPESKWNHNNCEMTIARSIGFGEVLGEEHGRGLPDRPLDLRPEEVEVVAERIARGFGRFVDNVRPFWSRLDSDQLADKIPKGPKGQPSGTPISLSQSEPSEASRNASAHPGMGGVCRYVAYGREPH